MRPCESARTSVVADWIGSNAGWFEFEEACAAGVISLRSSRVWSELEQPIVSGATALAVVAPSTEQQWRGTRILLEQSAYPVQTHEVRAGNGPCTIA